jgi:hypothetical protein
MIRLHRTICPTLLAVTLLGIGGCGGENPPAGSLSIPRSDFPEGGESPSGAPAAAEAPAEAAEGEVSMPKGGRVGLE